MDYYVSHCKLRTMKKIILFLVFFTSLSVHAQTNKTWIVSIGGSFPIGNYSSFSYDPNTLITSCGLLDAGASGGAASTGLNFGIEALFPMQNDKINFTLSADFHYNGLNGESKSYLNLAASYIDNALRNQIQSSGGASVSSSCVVNSTPSYINIPLLVGMRYTMPMNNGMDFFAEAGAGMNLRFVTPLVLTERMSYLYGGYHEKMTIETRYKYAMKGTMAFRLGAGVRFAEKLSLGAYYYYMGKGDVSVIVVSKELNDSSIQPSEQSAQYGTVNPMMAVIRLSYYF